MPGRKRRRHERRIGLAPVSVLLPSLRTYRRTWLRVDVLAGISLAALCVPVSMADARLAAMPPIVGLYAFLAGAFGAVLFSTSRQLSIGPDSTICPMMAVGVGSLVATTNPAYGSLVVLLALMLGIAVLAAGVARFGFLADLLPRPVMSGFLSGVGVTVVVGQLHVILGLPDTGVGTVPEILSVIGHLGQANGASLLLGLTVILLVLAGEHLDARFPGALAAVLVSLGAVVAFGLRSHGVAVVGELPSGLPPLALPAPIAADVTELIPVLVPIFLVTLAQTAATSRGFAAAGGYDVRIDRDFVAVGAGSLLAGLSGGFAVNASPTCTATVAASGGRSQTVNLVAAGLVGAVLLLATGVLANLPEVTLGGILVAVGFKLIQWRDLAAIARYSRPEWAIALFTLTVVALVGIQEGIYLAIVLALGRRTYLSARPGDSLLGRLPGGDGVWVSRHSHPEAKVPAGFCIFRYDAPLFYANAQHFADRLRIVTRESREPVRTVVVEAVGIDDLDFTGAKVLAEIDAELAGHGTTLALAHPFGRLGTELTSGSLAPRFSGRVFNSVDDAVAGLSTGHEAPL